MVRLRNSKGPEWLSSVRDRGVAGAREWRAFWATVRMLDFVLNDLGSHWTALSREVT